MPKRSRKGPVSRPVRVVAPMSVKRGRSRRMDRAAGPLPTTISSAKVLERGIEHLLHHAVETVDLVDEQDVALLEVGEDGGQVPRALDGWTAGRADVRARAHWPRRWARRGLAQARGAREQDVVRRRRRAPAPPRMRMASDSLILVWPEIVAQALGAQAAVERQVVFGEAPA